MKLKKDLISKSLQTRLYALPCPIIGLTGGIATGKSSASEIFQELGFNVICADKLVKEVYKSSKTIEHLKANYSQALADDQVNFKILRELFFTDKNIQEDIEKLIYSQLPKMFISFFKEFKNPELVIYDVPLLFEKGLDHLVDLKLTIYAPREKQLQRLMKRDQISVQLANEILDKQLDIELKKAKSDFIIDNSQDILKIRENVLDFCTNMTC